MSKWSGEASVVTSRALSDGIFELCLAAPEIAKSAVPGQFVMVYPKEGGRILGRPISICEADAEKGRYGVPFHQVKHFAVEVPTEIGQGGIGAHVLDRAYMLGAQQVLLYGLNGVGGNFAREERLHGVEGLFGLEQANHATQGHQRRREQ